MTPETNLDILRTVYVEVLTDRRWTLRTWDTHRQHTRGTTMIGYEFIMPNGEVLFSGEDFSASPLEADDSDESLRALLSFLTLRPGDTDREYFKDYTAAQMAFAESYECEAMQLYSCEPEGDEPPMTFQDVEETVHDQT